MIFLLEALPSPPYTKKVQMVSLKHCPAGVLWAIAPEEAEGLAEKRVLVLQAVSFRTRSGVWWGSTMPHNFQILDFNINSQNVKCSCDKWGGEEAWGIGPCKERKML